MAKDEAPKKEFRRNSYMAAAPLKLKKPNAGEPAKPGADDDEDFGTPESGIRKQVAHFMATSIFGVVMDLMSTFFALLSCALYIWSTYESDAAGASPFVFGCEIVMTSYFGFDYFLRIFIATRPLAYIVSGEAQVDLLALLPIMDRFVDEETKNERAMQLLIAIMRVMRILRIYRITRLLEYKESQVTKALLRMLLTIITSVVFLTGLIQVIENDYATTADGIAQGCEEQSFHYIFYFLMVTVSTVGYGDYSPKSPQGQMLIIFVIFAGIIYVSNASGEAIRLAGMSSPYARAVYTPYKGVPHVVVVGELSVSGLRDFFTEVFHKDHGSMDLQVVLLNPSLPNNEIQSLINHPRYSLSVVYLEGSPMNEMDLERVALDKARAAFVLTNKFSSRPDEADASTILQALSIKRFVRRRTGKEILQCLQLMRPENKHHFTSFCDEKTDTGAPAHRYCIVCVQEIKMKLLAQTCLCPGLVALISNLVSSTDEVPLGKDAQEWVSEYQEGSGYEVYTKPIPSTFSGVPFCEVAKCVFEVLGACLFALEITADDSTEPRIVLNPGNFVLPNVTKHRIRGFLFAEDDESADLTMLSDSFKHTAPTAGQAKTSAVVPKNGGQEGKEEKGGPKIASNAKKAGKGWGAVKGESANASAKLAAGKLSTQSTQYAELKEKYFVRDTPASIAQVTIVRSVAEDLPAVTEHLIIAGCVDNLYNFILTLRAKHLGHLQTILILHPTPPTKTVWDSIAIFPQVVYVQGSALHNADLIRAGVQRASKAVVFAPARESGAGGSSLQNEAMVDADTIFVYQGMLGLNPSIEVVTELVSYPNMAFLSPDMNKTQKSANSNPLASPQFASGAAYTSSMLDTLVCQAFYNPNIVTVLQQLVSGSDVKAVKLFDDAWLAGGHTQKIEESHLYQIPVPPQFHSKTYGSIVDWLLLTRGILSLGLFRGTWKKLASGPKGNRLSYVYTNPDKNASLESCDSIFILAQVPPDDLLVTKNSVADVTDSLSRARKLSKALSIKPPSHGGLATIGGGGGGGMGGPELISQMRDMMRSEMKGFETQLKDVTSQLETLKKKM